MAKSAAPLLLGGAALLLLATGGKKKKASSPIVEEEFDPAETGGSSSGPATSDGASSSVWKDRQQNLKSWGYYPGPIDGKPGAVNSSTSKTRAGIRKFQGDWGLSVDGKWGPNTQAAYEKRIAGQKPPCPGGGSSNWGWGDDGWDTGGGGEPGPSASSGAQWGSVPKAFLIHILDRPPQWEKQSWGGVDAWLPAGSEIAITAGIQGRLDNVPVTIVVDYDKVSIPYETREVRPLRRSELQALSNGKSVTATTFDGKWTFKIEPVV